MSSRKGSGLQPPKKKEGCSISSAPLSARNVSRFAKSSDRRKQREPKHLRKSTISCVVASSKR